MLSFNFLKNIDSCQLRDNDLFARLRDFNLQLLHWFAVSFHRIYWFLGKLYFDFWVSFPHFLLGLLAVVLIICVTRVAKAALKKALAENEDVDDIASRQLPILADSAINLHDPLIIKIDNPQDHHEVQFTNSRKSCFHLNAIYMSFTLICLMILLIFFFCTVRIYLQQMVLTELAYLL